MVSADVASPVAALRRQLCRQARLIAPDEEDEAGW